MKLMSKNTDMGLRFREIQNNIIEYRYRFLSQRAHRQKRIWMHFPYMDTAFSFGDAKNTYSSSHAGGPIYIKNTETDSYL